MARGRVRVDDSNSNDAAALAVVCGWMMTTRLLLAMTSTVNSSGTPFRYDIATKRTMLVFLVLSTTSEHPAEARGQNHVAPVYRTMPQ